MARITADDVADLYRDDPENFEAELEARLGMGYDDDGFATINTRAVRRRQVKFEGIDTRYGDKHWEPPVWDIGKVNFSPRDLGEAMVGSPKLFKKIVQNPYGMRGGRARTSIPAGMRWEDVGGSGIGPDTFSDINYWLGGQDRLFAAKMLEQYTLAVMLARRLVTWVNDVNYNDEKVIRYTIPTTVPDGGDGNPGEDEGTLPGQEFKAAGMASDYIIPPKGQKQTLALELTWESMHYSHDGGAALFKAAGRLAERFAVRVEERVERALWGIVPSYRYQGTLSDTYRSTGSYQNLLENTDLTEDAIDQAEQMLVSQTDPANPTLEVEPGTERMLIVTPGRRRRGWRIQHPRDGGGNQQVNTGDLSAGEEQIRADAMYDFELFSLRRGIRLMMAAAPRGLGITRNMARRRFIWGNTRAAFTYRSHKDFQSIQYSLRDSPGLSRRDIIAAWDCSEKGACGCDEPRYVVLGTSDNFTG